MPQKRNKTQMPEEIRFVWGSNASMQIGIKISQKYQLVLGQIARLTVLITKVFEKELAIDQFLAEVKKELQIKDDVAKPLVLDVLAHRLLILDNLWFEGKVAEEIKKMGGELENYQSFIKEFESQIVKEAEEEQAREELSPAEEDELNKQAGQKEEKPLVVTNPEEEKKSAKKIFSQSIKDILQTEDYQLKAELNVRLTTLLLADQAEKKFQRDLLDILYNNGEALTAKPLILKEQQVDPTIGNWLKDYVTFVGVEDVVSSIKKAQYFTAGENVKKISPEEKDLLDRLLDFYIALKNFYDKVERSSLEDVYIFPFSEEEQSAFLRDIQPELDKLKEQATKPDSFVQNQVDIGQAYQGTPEEENKIVEEKAKIIKQTRKEYNKVADVFEEYLLEREKYGSIACLEILAETGALDNLLAKDKRYQDFLLGYLKRSGLVDEQAGFAKNPYEAKYLKYFLKYVLLQRLALPEYQGARIVAKLSNVFREKGLKDYSQLAYFDLNENKFKWS